MTKRIQGAALVTGVILLLGIGLVSGNAMAATVMNSGDRLVTAPDYPQNEMGLSYGSALEATSPETEPDLILVVATNGVEGYALKTDLDRASGAVGFKSPEDALAWQSNQAGGTAVIVYAKDGKTVVGEFVVGGGSTDRG